MSVGSYTVMLAARNLRRVYANSGKTKTLLENGSSEFLVGF